MKSPESETAELAQRRAKRMIEVEKMRARLSGMGMAATAEGQEEAAGPPKPLRRQSTFLGKLAERAVNAAEKVTGVDLDGDGDVGEDGGTSPSTFRRASFNLVRQGSSASLKGVKFSSHLAERAVNAAEKVTGIDIDGDGDVGEDGGRSRLRRASSGATELTSSVLKKSGADVAASSVLGGVGSVVQSGKAALQSGQAALQEIDREWGYDVKEIGKEGFKDLTSFFTGTAACAGAGLSNAADTVGGVMREAVLGDEDHAFDGLAVMEEVERSHDERAAKGGPRTELSRGFSHSTLKDASVNRNELHSLGRYSIGDRSGWSI